MHSWNPHLDFLAAFELLINPLSLSIFLPLAFVLIGGQLQTTESNTVFSAERD